MEQGNADTTHSSGTEAQPPGSASEERNKRQDNEMSYGERAPGVCPPQQTPLGAAGKAQGAGVSLPAGIAACSTQGLELLGWTGQYLVLQNDRDCTCSVLTGDSARAFQAGIIAQTAQLDIVHLIFKNTNSVSGLLPALGKMKWRQVEVLWLCPIPSLAQTIPKGGFYWCCTGQRGWQFLCYHIMSVPVSAAFPLPWRGDFGLICTVW